MDRETREASPLQREPPAYLAKGRNGRRVAKVDPTDPKFSHAADEEREAIQMGVQSQIRYGPPKPGSPFSGR